MVLELHAAASKSEDLLISHKFTNYVYKPIISSSSGKTKWTWLFHMHSLNNPFCSPCRQFVPNCFPMEKWSNFTTLTRKLCSCTFCTETENGQWFFLISILIVKNKNYWDACQWPRFDVMLAYGESFVMRLHWSEWYKGKVLGRERKLVGLEKVGIWFSIRKCLNWRPLCSLCLNSSISLFQSDICRAKRRTKLVRISGFVEDPHLTERYFLFQHLFLLSSFMSISGFGFFEVFSCHMDLALNSSREMYGFGGTQNMDDDPE